MNQDDIEYILEILEEAIECEDWELIKEAHDYLKDFRNRKSSGGSEEN